MKNITLHTQGLMCHKCEAKAESAVLGIEGVIDAEADHEEQTVQVSCEDVVGADALATAVTEAGYQVVSVDEA